MSDIPAFPSKLLGTPYEDMSLRDYFAAQAMPQFIRILYENPLLVHGDESIAKLVAFKSYAIADKMLNIRTGGGE